MYKISTYDVCVVSFILHHLFSFFSGRSGLREDFLLLMFILHDTHYYCHSLIQSIDIMVIYVFVVYASRYKILVCIPSDTVNKFNGSCLE